MILVPRQSELDAHSQAFDQDWGGVDAVLYGLCRDHPGHGERRRLTAKLALIDRVYAAGLERLVVPPTGQQSIIVIADFFEAHAAEMDELLAALPHREPRCADDMSAIVAIHGRLLERLLPLVTGGKAPRSFASKYLHFHDPAVPIYDSYALATVTRLVRWDRHVVPFDPPTHSDDAPGGYYEFCLRFWRLLEACREAGLKVTVKSLDNYLWSVPKAG